MNWKKILAVFFVIAFLVTGCAGGSNAQDQATSPTQTAPEPTEQPEKTEETAAIAFDPNGRFVAVSVPQDDGEIQLWDLKTGEVLHSVTASHISALAFSRDGETLIAGDLYGAIGIFNIDRIES